MGRQANSNAIIKLNVHVIQGGSFFFPISIKTKLQCVYLNMLVVHLGFWWEKCLDNTVHVIQVDVKAHIAVSHFLAVDWFVIWTDITFTRERRHSDGVLQTGVRSAITQSAVDVALQPDRTYGR